MIRIRLAVVATLTLSGCVSVERAWLPSGAPVNQVSCSLSIDSMARCYRAAGDLCGPRGYVIYDWDGTPWPRPYPEPSTVDSDTTLASTRLLVACRPQEGQPRTTP